MLEGRRRFRGAIAAVDGETVTIRLPDAPKDQDAEHRIPLVLLADAKLVMTDALLNMARADQDENPIDDDGDIETIDVSNSEELSEEIE
jgi:ribosome maturation factor RimP